MYDLVKLGLVALFLFLRLVAPVAAGSLGDADVAYSRGDYATAMRLLRPLAEQGDPAAQYKVGILYETGHGVPQDYAEAMQWYRKAADQGDPNAQHNVGVLYTEGHGVPQDYGEALKWYRKAADQGLTEAMYNVGVLYAEGYGVPVDNVQAHMWFSLAATRAAPSDRAPAIKARDLVGAKMTAPQIAEAQKLAREWKPRISGGK